MDTLMPLIFLIVVFVLIVFVVQGIMTVLAFLRLPKKLDRVIELLERIDARLEQEADKTKNTN